MFHKAKAIETHRPATILLTFEDGEKRLFNMTELMEEEPFRKLKDNYHLFSQATLAPGGYGIIWTDEIDLATEAVWERGKKIP